MVRSVTEAIKEINIRSCRSRYDAERQADYYKKLLIPAQAEDSLYPFSGCRSQFCLLARIGDAAVDLRECGVDMNHF